MKVTFNRKVLALAVVSSLGGFMSISAQAVTLWPTGSTESSNPTVYAAEMVFDESTLLDNTSGVLDITTSLGFGASTGTVSFVRMDLSNGALFSCVPSGDVGGNALQTVQGGDQKSFVIYSYTAAGVVEQTETVTVTCGAYKPTASGDVTATYRLYPTSQAAVDANTTPLAQRSGLMWKTSPSYTFKSLVSTTNPDSKIDVTKGSVEFVHASGGAIPDTEVKTVMLGKFSLADNDGVYLEGSTAVTDTSGIDVVSTDTGTATGTRVVVNGDFSAFLSSTNKVYLSTSSDCATADNVATFTTAGAVIGIGNADYTEAYICAQANGSTAMSGGQYVISYVPKAASSRFIVSNSGEQMMYKLIKNGKSFKVLNIPNATASDQAFIRVYNSGSLPLTVRGTVYNLDGSTVGTANSVVVTGLAPNAVQVVNIAALQTAIGGTITSNRGWARMEAESANVEVALMIRAGGVLVNASGSIIDDAAFDK